MLLCYDQLAPFFNGTAGRMRMIQEVEEDGIFLVLTDSVAGILMARLR